MKSLKTFTTVVILVVTALLWTACKKEVSQQAAMNQSAISQDAQSVKQFGAVKDDINAINKVPLIFQHNF